MTIRHQTQCLIFIRVRVCIKIVDQPHVATYLKGFLLLLYMSGVYFSKMINMLEITEGGYNSANK